MKGFPAILNVTGIHTAAPEALFLMPSFPTSWTEPLNILKAAAQKSVSYDYTW